MATTTDDRVVEIMDAASTASRHDLLMALRATCVALADGGGVAIFRVRCILGIFPAPTEKEGR